MCYCIVIDFGLFAAHGARIESNVLLVVWLIRFQFYERVSLRSLLFFRKGADSLVKAVPHGQFRKGSFVAIL